MKDRLMAPELVLEFMAEFQREVKRERVASMAARGDVERRLAKVVKDIDSIISAITAGMYHTSMKQKMDVLEAEKAALEGKLHEIPEPDPILLHPGLFDIYTRKVANLAEALNDEGSRPEAADILRGLIEKVVLRPDPDAAKGHVIEIFGELCAILSLCGNGLGTKAKARTGGAGVWQVSVVAGAGFEPAAFRL